MIRLYSPRFRHYKEKSNYQSLAKDPDKLKDQFKKWLYKMKSHETIH
jgi:hypothetical protein